MTGTLGDMKARVASELARSDLTSQIALAITDAIGVYQKERFRFNETVPDAASGISPKKFNTVAGRQIYTSADLADISTVEKLDYILMQVGQTIFQLKREDPKVVKLYNQTNTMMGQPGWWAYEGNELILAAIPDQAYTIYLDGVFVAPAPASDVEANNPWMIAGEKLIRSRAKFEIATHVTRNPVMAAAMSPDPPGPGEKPGAAWREFRRLKSELGQIIGRGIVRATQF